MSYSTNALFTRAIEQKDVRHLTSLPKVLYNESEQKWLEFILDYLDTYRTVPIMDVFLEHNKAFRTETVNEEIPTAYIYDQIVPKIRKTYIKRILSEEQSKGTDIFIPEYLEDLAKVTKPTPIDVVQLSKLETSSLIQNAKMYSYGIDWFDNALGKLAATDMVGIYGRAKSAKTTLLSLLIIKAYKQGNKLMVFNNELSVTHFMGKLVSLLGSINPRFFRDLEINEDIMGKLREVEDVAKSNGGDILTYGRINSHADIVSAVNNAPFRPDIVYVDALNNCGKMSSSTSERSLALGSVIIGLRNFTLDEHIPVIFTAQLNRQASGKQEISDDQIAESDQNARSVDGAISIIPTDINGEKYYKLSSFINRHGDNTHTTFMHVDWDIMKMSFHNLADTVMSEETLVVEDQELKV